MNWIEQIRQKDKKRIWLSLGLTILCCSLAVLINNSVYAPLDLTKVKQMMEKKIHQKEQEVEKLMNNATFLLKATDGAFPSDSMLSYSQKGFTFLIYDEDNRTIFWNQNRDLPLKTDSKYSTKEAQQVYDFGGSYYIRIQKPYSLVLNGEHFNYALDALIPLYKNYSIRNAYLESYFSQVPSSVGQRLVVAKEANEFPVFDSKGNKLFHIEEKQDSINAGQLHWVVFFCFLSLLGILMAMAIILGHMIRLKYWKMPLGIGLGAVICIRMLMWYTNFPNNIATIPIFSVPFAYIPFLGDYSLGYFIIDTLFVLYLVLILQYFLDKKKTYTLSQREMNLQTSAFFAVVFIGLIGISWTLKVTLQNPSFLLRIDNISQANLYSVIPLLCKSALILSFFIINYNWYSILVEKGLELKEKRTLFLGISFFLLVMGLLAGQSIYTVLTVEVFAILYVYLLDFVLKRSLTTFAWMGFWLLFFSLFSTFIIERGNQEYAVKVRQEFLKELVFERDLSMEESFDTIASQIQNNQLISFWLRSPLTPSPRRQVVELIKYEYLDNRFFGQYDYSVHLYSETGNPQRGEKRSYKGVLEQIYKSQKTANKFLQFCSNEKGTYSYLSKIPIILENNLLGIVVIEFKPKKKENKSKVYVELLKNNDLKKKKDRNNFTYAIYKQGKLVKSNGEFFLSDLHPEFKEMKRGSYLYSVGKANDENSYIVYKSSYNEYVGAVVIPKFSLWKMYSIFTSIFCLGLIIIIGFYLLNQLILYLVGRPLIEVNFEDSLRERIQRGIISVIIASFIAIAMVTIVHSQRQYNNYHKERLKRKMRSTAKTATWQIQQGVDSVASMIDAKTLSDIHKIDVNIYDTKGNLSSSSEEAIFERKILGRKMNPVVYQKMRYEADNPSLEDEQINNFKYIAAYVPLKNRQNEVIAYLNLPYDIIGSSEVGTQYGADFLGTLLNVYVLFLLIAGIAAFLIAISVTNPLLVIGDKLRKVKLGQKNEHILWDNKDEIGELIEQYNQMIDALEESTAQLARSQKETAWREMAKQVAHEIKNPLTPMKLNIQLLQRVVNQNPEKAQRLVDRVSNTLVEQIDSLAHIASEFSNFAQMPPAQNEVLELSDLVTNVYALFKEEEHVVLNLDVQEGRCLVFADKTQIMRVLNNLVKNAVQAMTEEREGKVDIMLNFTSTTALIRVRDNGCGIPEEQREEIFVPNFTTKSSGTGIGLSMSKKIVEIAKGKIYFESELNVGTEFTVELPLHKEESM